MEALGVFRVWLYENHIPQNFPKYVGNKVKQGVFLPSRAELLIEAVSVKVAASKPVRRIAKSS